jgi:hypothetical protein
MHQPTSLDTYEDIVPMAADVLAEWPRNFFHMLETFTSNNAEIEPVHLSGDLRGIYMSLTYGIKPRGHGDFLRAALSAFAVNHRGSGSRDKNLGFNQEYSNIYLPKAKLAQKLGIDPRTANRVLVDEGVATVKVARGTGVRVLIDITNLQLNRRTAGAVHRLKVASRMIGIPGPVLRLLWKSGDYEVNHLPKGMPGFHELDVEAFVAKLRSCAPPKINKSVQQRRIRFDQINKHPHCTVEIKATMVRRILNGELSVVGCEGDNVGGLLIPKELFLSYLRHDIERAVSQSLDGSTAAQSIGVMTITESAQELRCSPKSIPILMDRGYLTGKWNAHVLWIGRKSAERFGEQYLSIVSIAKRLRTNPSALMQFCRAHKIRMVVCRLGGKDGSQGFVRTRDEHKLLNFRSFESKRAKARRLRRAA